MNRIIIAVALVGSSVALGQGVLYEHTMNPSGSVHKSAWYPPDGLDSDIYCWDSFILGSDRVVTEVRWMGAYTNFLGGAGKTPVFDFTVAIWASGLGGANPDLLNGPLEEYEVGSNAGETPAGITIYAGWPVNPQGYVPVYNYAFVLPKPFAAAAGAKYWIEIVAWQGLTPQYHWPPDWAMPGATGGNGSHFRRINDGAQYQTISHDLAFSLLGPVPCYADCEGDGDLDVFDFLCFQGEFANQAPYADCEQDGDWDVFDFLCFQGAFAGGCG